MPLKDYEIEVLIRLYDNGLIYFDYKSTEKVARIIKWSEIARKFNVRRKFKSVKKKLLNKGYVYDAGKSCKVVSLSIHGVAFVEASLNE